MQRADSFEKTLMLGKIEGTIEDEMVGCHHRLDGHEFEQTPGVGDGQGSLACGGHNWETELNTTERHQQGFPGGLVVKNLPANAGDTRDLGSIPGLGISSGVGNHNPF